VFSTGSAGIGQTPHFLRQSGLVNLVSVSPFGWGFSEAWQGLSPDVEYNDRRRKRPPSARPLQNGENE
jgi:hypothetical protein